MKIRNGFVSNSSSSSFVVIGVKQKGSYDDIEELENSLPEGIRTLYTECKDYDYITGYVLADVSSEGDYLEDRTLSFVEINKIAVDVAEALKVDISKVELIMGTRPS